MREPDPIILAVGPTPTLALRALTANGLTPDGGRCLRMVTRFTGLRGWKPGTPVVAVETGRWAVLAGQEGAILEHTLMRMLECGRLRIAQEADLARFREASSWPDEVRRNDKVASKRGGLSATPREGRVQ